VGQVSTRLKAVFAVDSKKVKSQRWIVCSILADAAANAASCSGFTGVQVSRAERQGMATDSEGDSDGDSAQHTSSSDSDGDSDGDSAQHTSSSDSDGDSDGDSAQHTSSSDSDGDSDGDSAQHTSSSDSDGDSDGDSAQRATSRSSLPVLMRNSLNSNDDMHGRVPVAAV
jgi:hypothetical protein